MAPFGLNSGDQRPATGLPPVSTLADQPDRMGGMAVPCGMGVSRSSVNPRHTRHVIFLGHERCPKQEACLRIDMTVPSSASTPTLPGGLRIAYWACFLIAIAVVFRRVVALASPALATNAGVGGLDVAFASRPMLTLAHVLPALAFVLLTPFVVFRASTVPVWPERLLLPLGAMVGVTAYLMSGYAIGGWIERSAVLFFNSLFLFALLQAYRFGRGRNPVLQRQWLTRAIWILLGIATTRPIMGMFFATRSLTHLEPSQFFGIAFWIGFSINTIAVEFWIARNTRSVRG